METNESPRQNKEKRGIRFNRGLYFIDVDKYKTWSSKELWENKNNRFKFFAWIFAFLACIIALNVLSICQIALWSSNKNQIIQNMLFIVSGQFTENDALYNWNQELTLLIISLIFEVIILCSLSLSIFKCYKNKSFKFISFLPTLFVFLQAIEQIISVIWTAIDSYDYLKLFDISWVYVADFSTMFIYPFIWFFVSRNVAVIRNLAIQLEMREQLSQQTQQMFGGPGNPYFSHEQLGHEMQNNNENYNFNTNDAFYLKMKNLSREQLNEIAKALSISGYENMSDNELIKIISDIRNIQNNESVDKEVKIIEDEEKEEIDSKDNDTKK